MNKQRVMNVDTKRLKMEFYFKNFRYALKDILKNKGIDKGGEVQQYIDSECLRLCEPFIPRDTGALIQSGITNTVLGSGELKWNTPYARRWYYQPANFQGAPMRGNYWFERCKQQYKKQILEGAKRKIK